MNLPWLDPGDPFPEPALAWDERQPAPGLLAAGGALDVDTLRRAYSAGIFPWWSDGRPAGGLYCVAIGQAVFGESMFTRVPDASKIALAALVAFCLHHGIPMIDCQQNTEHLASLGAREIARAAFVAQVAQSVKN